MTGRRARPRTCRRPVGALLLAAFVVAPALAAAGQLPAGPAAAAGLPLVPSRTVSLSVERGTWMSVDISPDGRTIVCDILGNLYTLPADGGQARALTDGLSYDSQPVFAPDGRRLAFLSDRSGPENVWTLDLATGELQQASFLEGDPILQSPEWKADGSGIFFSRYRPEIDRYELHELDLETHAVRLLRPARTDGVPRAGWVSTLGAMPSRDGRWIYYASHTGERSDDFVPEWTIERRELASGKEERLVSAPRSPRPDLVLGTAMRPVVSPDGRSLVYAARHEGRTGLRLRDLESGADRWLAFPVQHDQLGGFSWSDLMPRYTFLPDGSALLLTVDGELMKLRLADGVLEKIPFRATLEQSLGALTRHQAVAPRGPVKVRLIQHAAPSPDGRHVAFVALGDVYVKELAAETPARRLTDGTHRSWQPAWSPDGREIAWVTWTADEGGALWKAPAFATRPRALQLSTDGAFYSNPAFAPTGGEILALRSNRGDRQHAYMEFGTTRSARLVAVQPGSGERRVLFDGLIGGRVQFTATPDVAYVNSADGLLQVRLDGTGAKRVVLVTGPGYYFVEGRVPVDQIEISPDGRHALVLIAQQLHLLRLPDSGGREIDLADAGLVQCRLTALGADYAGWGANGRSLHWTLGSVWSELRDAPVLLADGRGDCAPLDLAEDVRVRTVDLDVSLPRDVPAGSVLLRGATVITMGPRGVLPAADILVTGRRIVEVAPVGELLPLPEGVRVIDVRGKYVIPGLVDNHNHVADVRRDVLDFAPWGPVANLAWGVTTVFDPSTLTVDMLAYEDALEAGLMRGARILSTGPAIFSFNEFTSYAEVHAVLRRYKERYRLQNIKMYRSGNRRVRQWIAMAASELGLHPAAEGANAMKFDFTIVLDGYASLEHALPVVPLAEDVRGLLVHSGTSYTTTLMIGNGGPQGQDYFISRGGTSDDPKFRRFTPPFVADMKTRTRMWREPGEYLFPAIARSATRVLREGGLLGMASHGEMPGIGMHWEMQAHILGGMTPTEALFSGTLGAARAIGWDAELGSLEAGKLADLVVLADDPREDLAALDGIIMVMKGGRLHDGETLAEIWPHRAAAPVPWYLRDIPMQTPVVAGEDSSAAPDLRR